MKRNRDICSRMFKVQLRERDKERERETKRERERAVINK